MQKGQGTIISRRSAVEIERALANSSIKISHALHESSKLDWSPDKHSQLEFISGNERPHKSPIAC